ncbi:MAG: carbohydrate ABC transporter permease [Planctomycetota bacterium]|jgi:multiple sugar transport system permease protein|nr:carbohydrate ABC transporter permease [Planctomycetota bacterium]MDP6940902.1 carbohydrate ABC transporter permease [Planctomycetota bacterium]
MKKLYAYLPLVLGAGVMLFPLWWMFVVSLENAGRAGAAAAGGEVALWPTVANWSNYTDALRELGARPWDSFLDAFANSVVVTVLVVIGQVLSCSLVGYSFARIRFRGSKPLFVLMLATMMLPPQVTMIPLFLFFRSLGWVDTILPLVVPAFFGNAFFIFMFRQFFSQIPQALVEAARLDGCGHFSIWWRIMLPICKPVIAICAVFSFIFAWNDFLIPLIYLHSEEQSTLAVALNSFRNQYGGLEDVQYLMAVSIVTMIPCVLLFFSAQKQFVEGLGKGAVKG